MEFERVLRVEEGQGQGQGQGQGFVAPRSMGSYHLIS
jgi:hypothetical protein